MSEAIAIALIGWAGVATTALAMVAVAWIKERGEARKDRDTADRVLDAWELLSLSQSQRCYRPDGERADLNGATDSAPNTRRPNSE